MEYNYSFTYMCVGGCLYVCVCIYTHFFFFWPRHMACVILVPQTGIENAPPALQAPSLNYWIRAVPIHSFSYSFPL